MHKHAPRVGKVSWRFWNRPKLFLQFLGKPASHLQALDRELKASQTLRTLGRGQCMRSHGPKVGKVSWRFGIGPDFFCRLSASLRVICKRQIANLKRHKLRVPQIRGSACAGTGPEQVKFPGVSEKAQTFSGDSREACESFSSVTNFAHPRQGAAYLQAKFPGLSESAQTFSAGSRQGFESFTFKTDEECCFFGENDSIDHTFIHCSFTKSFIQKVICWFNVTYNSHISPTIVKFYSELILTQLRRVSSINSTALHCSNAILSIVVNYVTRPQTSLTL